MFGIKKDTERKRRPENRMPINIGIFITGGEKAGIDNGRNECGRNDCAAGMDLDRDTGRMKKNDERRTERLCN
jgi:hypothetical protein